eukprot:1388699-Pyramimonas_sp.AAC.1
MRFFTDKQMGTISANWKQLVRIEITGPNTAPRIEFAEEHLCTLGLCKQAIKDKLEPALAPTAGPARWSV